MRIEHPTFIHEQPFEQIALQVRPSQPPKQRLTPQHHIEDMVSMVTKSPERKQVKGYLPQLGYTHNPFTPTRGNHFTHYSDGGVQTRCNQIGSNCPE